MTTHTTAPKAARPETTGETEEWQRTTTHYARLGLCDRCAAQAAYGHQHGFRLVNPPCPLCSPVVATFDLPAAGPWRKASRALRRGAQGRAVRAPVTATATVLGARLSAPEGGAAA